MQLQKKNNREEEYKWVEKSILCFFLKKNHATSNKIVVLIVLRGGHSYLETIGGIVKLILRFQQKFVQINPNESQTGCHLSNSVKNRK